MQICNDGHDAICFTCRSCPACCFLDNIKEADEECSAALATVDELKGTIDDLQEQLGKAKRLA